MKDHSARFVIPPLVVRTRTHLRRLSAVLLVGACLAAGWLVGTASADRPDVVRGRGQTAFATLGLTTINGVSYRTNVTVTRDLDSGNTTLFIRAITPTSPPFGNSTTRILRGPIPSTDFVVASDLTSASLTTTISTDAINHYFENAEVGPITSFPISLTWTGDAVGHLNDTYVFNGRTVGDEGYAYRETYHQNGDHAEGAVTGMFGMTSIGAAYGTLDSNRSFDISQPR